MTEPTLESFVDMPDEIDDETAASLLEETTIRQDMTGEVCPYPQIEAQKALEKLDDGELLVQETDHVPSTENVPESVDELAAAKVWRSGDGQYRIFLRKQ